MTGRGGRWEIRLESAQQPRELRVYAVPVTAYASESGGEGCRLHEY